jgi:cytochrome c553
MKNTKTLRLYIICGLSLFAACLPGCSILEKNTAADTLTATAETAFYTCDGCHGPKNLRVEFMSPKIIGQKKAYLAAKLRDFRDLKRINPYMNGVVEKLSNQDIDNLAAYYSNYEQSKK